MKIFFLCRRPTNLSIDRFYFHHRQGATSSYGPADLSNHHGQQPIIKDEPVDVIQPESSGYFNHQYQHGGGYYPPFHHHHQASDYQSQRARDCLYQQPSHHRPAISPSPSPTSNYAAVSSSSSAGFVHPPTAYPSYGSTHHHPSQSQAPLIGPHHPRNFTVHPFHRHPKLSVSTPPSSPQVTTSDVLNMHHHHHMIQHPTVQQPHYPAIQTSSTTASNACQPPPIKVKRGKSPIRLAFILRNFSER